MAATADFASCVASSGIQQIADKATSLVNITEQIAKSGVSSGSLRTAVNQLAAQGSDYTALGGDFKGAPNCSDVTFGGLVADVGDSLVSVGEGFSGLDYGVMERNVDFTPITDVASEMDTIKAKVSAIVDYLQSKT